MFNHWIFLETSIPQQFGASPKKSLLFDATVFAPGSQTARQIWDKFAAGWIWMKLGMTMKSKWYHVFCVWTIGGCWNVSSLDSFSILIIISFFLLARYFERYCVIFNKPTILLPPPPPQSLTQPLTKWPSPLVKGSFQGASSTFSWGVFAVKHRGMYWNHSRLVAGGLVFFFQNKSRMED